MSLQAITYVLGDKNHRGPAVQGARLLVLLSLAHHAGDEGECWPGIPTIARETRLTDKHVRSSIRDLVKAGEIERIERGAPDARIRQDRLTNLYRLTGYLRARGDLPESAGTHSVGTRKSGQRPGSKPTSKTTGTRVVGTKPSSDAKPSSSNADDPALEAFLNKLRKGEPIHSPGGLAASARGTPGHVSAAECAVLLAAARAQLAAESSQRNDKKKIVDDELEHERRSREKERQKRLHEVAVAVVSGLQDPTSIDHDHIQEEVVQALRDSNIEPSPANRVDVMSHILTAISTESRENANEL